MKYFWGIYLILNFFKISLYPGYSDISTVSFEITVLLYFTMGSNWDI